MIAAWLEIAICAVIGITGAIGGWSLRELVDNKKISDTLLANQKQTIAEQNNAIHSQQDALDAAKAYSDAQAKLKPQILKVQADAKPIILTLDSCALPADAAKLLNAAADIADAAIGKLQGNPAFGGKNAASPANSTGANK